VQLNDADLARILVADGDGTGWRVSNELGPRRIGPLVAAADALVLRLPHASDHLVHRVLLVRP
jgi:hypothetical protein